MSCEDQLRALGLSSLEKRKLRVTLIALCSFLRRGDGQGRAELFPLVATGSVGMAQCCTRAALDWTLGNISPKRVCKHWNRLPTEAIRVPACQCLSP